jgi:hypothetical protein
VAIEQVSLAEVRKQLRLPESAEFLGYVVHLPVSDEFLALSQKGKGIAKRAFVQTPQLARLYDDYHAALRDAAECKQKAEVGVLFDVGDQLFYASIVD